MKTTYFIDGMHCQQCVSKVKAALEQLPEVTTQDGTEIGWKFREKEPFAKLEKSMNFLRL